MNTLNVKQMITCIDQILYTRYFWQFYARMNDAKYSSTFTSTVFMAKALYLEAKVFFYMPLAYIFSSDFGICRNSHTTTNKT